MPLSQLEWCWRVPEDVPSQFPAVPGDVGGVDDLLAQFAEAVGDVLEGDGPVREGGIHPFEPVAVPVEVNGRVRGGGRRMLRCVHDYECMLDVWGNTSGA